MCTVAVVFGREMALLVTTFYLFRVRLIQINKLFRPGFRVVCYGRLGNLSKLDPEKLSNLPRVMQLVNVRAQIRT